MPPRALPNETAELVDHVVAYQGRFRISRYQFRHGLYQGGQSAVLRREVFERGTALEYFALEDGALAALVEAVAELVAADAETALIGDDMVNQFGGLVGQGARRHIGSGCKKGRPQ